MGLISTIDDEQEEEVITSERSGPEDEVIRVRCSDGVTRLGRIKGKMKKRAWIREGDIIIIVPWSFQDDKCDITYRYTPPQRDWLRRNNYL